MTANWIGILCGGFFIMAFFIGGVAAIIIGFRNRRKGTESQNWPSTSGKITRVEIRRDTNTDEDGFTNTSFIPEIEYQYKLGSEVYTSKRVSFGGTKSFSSQKKATESISQYQLDGPVAVYYNPEKPDEAVLVQGNKGTMALIIAGAVFVAVSICGSCLGIYFLVFSQ